jgi:hypothetical protein
MGRAAMLVARMCASASNPMFARSLAVLLAIIVAETVHGVLRTWYLLPRVGDLASRQIGVFTGSLLIVAISIAAARWIGASRPAHLLAIGAMWVALMVAFEVALGRLAFGFPWSRIAEDFDLSRGGLLPLGLVTLAFAPLVAARIRRVR